MLLTGTANAWLRYNRINRSRANHGVSARNCSYGRVLGGEVSQNGYTVAIGPPPPDTGKGLDVREDSEIRVEEQRHHRAVDGISATTPSPADAVVSIYGNVFKANTVDGLYAEPYLSTSTRKIIATVGGTAPGQANTLRDHTGGAFHAISCVSLTTQFVCPSGGNVFVNNTNNIESTCPSSCVH